MDDSGQLWVPWPLEVVTALTAKQPILADAGCRHCQTVVAVATQTEGPAESQAKCVLECASQVLKYPCVWRRGVGLHQGR